MSCDLLRLHIIRKDEKENYQQSGSTTIYDVYAYCEGQAHQLGPFECTLDREKVLHEFEQLLPQVSYSSIVRGSFQKAEFQNIRTNLLDELSDIGNSIFTSIDQDIRRAINTSKNIHLFTNDTLIPWEIMYDDDGDFVSLKYSFAVSPTSKKRVSIGPRRIRETLRIMLIVDPQENLPQARIETDNIISLLKDNPRIDDPIVLSGKKEATWSNVRDYLKQESFDILHVAAHTKFDNQNADDTGIILSGGDILHPSDIFYDLRGDPPWLIFMNSCESARTTPQSNIDKYGELTSLADSFITAGALSYVGTSGAINDSSASEIAVEFYKRLFESSSVAESLRKSKKTFFEYNQSDLTWSLFKIYGSPSARIELGKTQDDLESKIKRWHKRTNSCDPIKCAIELGIDINEAMDILSSICRKNK